MTRHAKKTHPEFFTASEVGIGERRLASTPTPAKLEAAKNRKERSISDPGPVQPAALIVSNPTPSQIAMFRPVLSPSRVVTDFQRLGTADASNSSSMSSTTPATFGGDNVIYNNIELKSTDFGTIYSKPKESNEPYPFPPSQPATVSVIVSPHNSVVIHRQQHIQQQQLQQQPQQHQIQKDEDVLENYYENSSDQQLDAQVKSEFDSAETAMKDFMDDKDKIDMESYLKEIDSSYFETKPPPTTPQFQLGSNFSSTIKEEPSSRPTTPSQPIPPMQTMMSTAAVEATTAAATVLQPQQEPNIQAAAVRPAARTVSLASESDVRYSSSVPSHKYSAKHSLLRTQSQDSITRTKNPVLPSVYTEGHLVVPERKKVQHSFPYDSFCLDLSDESQQFFSVDDDSQNYFQPWH